MADADASIAGCCGLCIYSTLASWCILHTFGADVQCCQCGGSRGCCGSCCDSSFNKDDLDERMEKEQAKNAGPVDSQPVPSPGMSREVASDPKSTNAAGV